VLLKEFEIKSLAPKESLHPRGFDNMIRVTLSRRVSGQDESAPAYHYSLAGQAVAFQTQVVSLAAFEQGPASNQFSEMCKSPYKVEMLDSNNASLKYSGMASFNGSNRQVDYWRKNGHAQIDIDGEAACSIDLDEEHIHLLNQNTFDDPLNLEIITGPALVILLAQKQVYCMHSGAISTPMGNIMLIAESGAGKSTLSAHVNKQWSQLCDDILPLRLDGAKRYLEFSSNFPQLKLDGGCVAERSSADGKIDFVLRISPSPSNNINFRQMDRTDAMLQLIRHTVAAKLFDQAAMRAHAKFAKKVSGLLPVIEISYPRNIAQLSELRQEIITYLGRYE
jgi:hypothetical protein